MRGAWGKRVPTETEDLLRSCWRETTIARLRVRGGGGGAQWTFHTGRHGPALLRTLIKIKTGRWERKGGRYSTILSFEVSRDISGAFVKRKDAK